MLEQRVFSEINCLLQWFASNKLKVNADKTSLVEFSINNRNDLGLTCLLGESDVFSVDSTKYLGLIIDKNLRFSGHIDKVSRSVSSGTFVLRRLSTQLNPENLITVYYGLIYPHLSYGIPVWGFKSARTDHLFKLQKRAIRAMFQMRGREHCREHFRRYKILTLPSIYIMETLTFVKRNPALFPSVSINHNFNLRNRNNLPIPRHRTSFSENHLLQCGVRLFNSLPDTLKLEGNLTSFKRQLKSVLLDHAFYNVVNFINHD